MTLLLLKKVSLQFHVFGKYFRSDCDIYKIHLNALITSSATRSYHHLVLFYKKNKGVKSKFTIRSLECLAKFLLELSSGLFPSAVRFIFWIAQHISLSDVQTNYSICHVVRFNACSPLGWLSIPRVGLKGGIVEPCLIFTYRFGYYVQLQTASKTARNHQFVDNFGWLWVPVVHSLRGGLA